MIDMKTFELILIKITFLATQVFSQPFSDSASTSHFCSVGQKTYFDPHGIFFNIQQEYKRKEYCEHTDDAA